MSEDKNGETPDYDRVALEITRSAARFTRIVGRVPGLPYSAMTWRLLAELEQSGAARVSVLARSHRVAQPTMTGIVQRLKNEGWVIQSEDPQDARATLVSITPEGIQSLDRYRKAAAARLSPLLHELSDFDRATLLRAAELMTALSNHPDLPRT